MKRSRWRDTKSSKLILERAGSNPRWRSVPKWQFIDIGLPGFDGYEVARRIRSVFEVQRMMLIALTGYGLPKIDGELRKRGSMRT